MYPKQGTQDKTAWIPEVFQRVVCELFLVPQSWAYRVLPCLPQLPPNLSPYLRVGPGIIELAHWMIQPYPVRDADKPLHDGDGVTYSPLGSARRVG